MPADSRSSFPLHKNHGTGVFTVRARFPNYDVFSLLHYNE